MARWPQHEYETLDRLYPTGGSRAVRAALPHHSKGSINAVAHRRGVKFLTSYAFDAAVIESYGELKGDTIAVAAKVGCCRRTVYRALDRDYDRKALQRNRVLLTDFLAEALA